MVSTPLTSVAICVATYKRPQGLGKLLESLKEIDTSEMSVELIVADNDSAESARSCFEKHTVDLPYPASYVVVSDRGIVCARNRLTKEARNIGATYIAFADDDQTVHSTWLKELVNTANRYQCAAVAPTVRYSFPPETPSGLQQIFAPGTSPRATGTSIRNVSTNGALYRLNDLNDLSGPFDMRANLSGGSDILLGLSLIERGHTLIACDSAFITEHMPSSRLRFQWFAMRAWRGGSNRAQQVRLISPSRMKSVKWFILFIGFFFQNLLLILPDVIRHRHLPFRRIHLLIFCVSFLWHMSFGVSKYEEYAGPVHGT